MKKSNSIPFNGRNNNNRNESLKKDLRKISVIRHVKSTKAAKKYIQYLCKLIEEIFYQQQQF